MAPRSNKPNRSDLIKTADVEYHLRCASGAKAIYREEVWEDETGKVLKYNLAFVHFGVCQRDHGRVVGYDNAHGHDERHFMGEVQEFKFVSYDVTVRKFQNEAALQGDDMKTIIGAANFEDVMARGPWSVRRSGPAANRLVPSGASCSNTLKTRCPL